MQKNSNIRTSIEMNGPPTDNAPTPLRQIPTKDAQLEQQQVIYWIFPSLFLLYSYIWYHLYFVNTYYIKM
jgi:hypothetical protein